MNKLSILIVMVFLPGLFLGQVKTYEFDFGYPSGDAVSDAVRLRQGGFAMVGSGKQDTSTIPLNPAFLLLDENLDTLLTRYYDFAFNGVIIQVEQTVEDKFICLAKIQRVSDPAYSNSGIVWLDSDGSLLKYKQYNTTVDNNTSNMIVLPDGGVIIAGDRGDYALGSVFPYAIRIDRNGNEIWNKQYQALGVTNSTSNICQKRDGGFVISGRNGVSNDYKIFEVTIDANGDVISHQRVLTNVANDENWGNMVRETSDRGFLFAGGDREHQTSFVLKTDSNFNQQWYSYFPGGGAIVELENKNYLFAGHDELGTNEVVTRCDSNGTSVFKFEYKHTNGEEVFTKAIPDGDGGILSSGYFKEGGNPLETEYYWNRIEDVGIPVVFNEGCKEASVYWASASWSNDTVMVEGSHDSSLLSNNTDVYTWWILQDGRILFGDSLAFTFNKELWPDTFWVAMVTFDGIYCSDTLVINAYNNDVLPNYVGVRDTDEYTETIPILGVFPNPAQGTFYIELPKFITSGSEISMYSSSCEKVKDLKYFKVNDQLMVDVATQARGMYYLIIHNENGILGRSRVVLD